MALGRRQHNLLNVFPRPENRFLRCYFRKYEFRYCTDSTELAHVQMGNDPIAAFKHLTGQHDLQPFIAVSHIVVQNSDTCTATNRFELTNSRRTFKPAVGWAVKLRHKVELIRENQIMNIRYQAVTLEIFQPLRGAVLREIRLRRIKMQGIVDQFAYREPAFLRFLNGDRQIGLALRQGKGSRHQYQLNRK